MSELQRPRETDPGSQQGDAVELTPGELSFGKAEVPEDQKMRRPLLGEDAYGEVPELHHEEEEDDEDPLEGDVDRWVEPDAPSDPLDINGNEERRRYGGSW